MLGAVTLMLGQVGTSQTEEQPSWPTLIVGLGQSLGQKPDLRAGPPALHFTPLSAFFPLLP